MPEIIDLSQEIYEEMPVYKDLPQVKMTVHNSHEKCSGMKDPEIRTPAVHKLELGEHTGTHVDAINTWRFNTKESQLIKCLYQCTIQKEFV